MATLSPRGRKFIYAHEGCPLTAYLDPVGIWTIGPGLTAADRVITPKRGMTITQAEADRIFSQVMAATYEPAVRRALGESIPQHVHDGAASFTFNCGPGAIATASWVKSWLAGAWSEVKRRLSMWNKGGGRVLPGLTRRRKEEGDIIVDNVWPAGIEDIAAAEPTPEWAVFVVSVSAEDIVNVRDALRQLGYDPGPVTGRVSYLAINDFQMTTGLKVDGKIGRATLATIQRELDRKRQNDALATTTKVGAPTGVAVGTGAEVIQQGADAASGNAGDIVTTAALTGLAVPLIVGALVLVGFIVYRYRGRIFGAGRVRAGFGG